ncbi:MAG: YihY/virulence factor BrkB family protein [Myxococcales bacterium]|nr:YihY/virulence factor BrkB family protein [Myxococcales bacterium]
MNARLATAWALSRDAARIFSQRGARLMSGSVAFYALVSVVPILVIALELAALVVDEQQARSTTAVELESWVGRSGAATLLSLVGAVRGSSHSTLTSVLGALVLVYASTRLFTQLTTALDLLWETPPEPDPKDFAERVRRQAKRRGLAFAMVILVGVSLTATVLLHAGLAAGRRAAGLDVPVSRLVEAPASLVLTSLLFAAMFRLLPRGRVRLPDALVGGAVTSILFTAGALLVTAFVARRDTTVYGAAASLVVLLLWMHYSAQAFFFGAAFTVAHARRRDLLSRAEE